MEYIAPDIFFLFRDSDSSPPPPLNGQQMKSDIQNYRCPSVACHHPLNVCFSVKINTFSTHDLSGNLGFFWSLKSAFGSVDYWIIAYSLVEFPLLGQPGSPAFISLAEGPKGNGEYFFPLPQPSLNSDSLGPWGFASYFQSGATFYLRQSYLSLVFCLEPFMSSGTWLFL